MIQNKVIVICGPTGSGKSSLAIKLAQKLDTEIISADSLAIYKNLDIGTAKPTAFEQSLVKHHMIDVVSPFSTFSVSDYQNMAMPIIENLIKNKKTPIICGGTGFYINSLLFDLSYGNCSKDDEIRQKFEKVLQDMGADYLFDILKEVDNETANKLHKNDTKRVIRALEIYYSSGKKKSEICDDLTPRYPYVAVSYDYPRDELYLRINKRVDNMFAEGLTEEVKNLMNMGLNTRHQAMQAIGYKEFFAFDDIDNNLENIKELIKKNSRNYAKRQITFFKKLPNIQYVKSANTDQDADKILGIINNEY